RRAFARADQQVVLALEEESERESAAQLLERGLDGGDGRLALLHLVSDQMRDDLGVGLADELGAVLAELLAQLTEILDDAVVHDGNAVGRVRMRVFLAGPAMCRLAGVTDADHALKWLFLQ